MTIFEQDTYYDLFYSEDPYKKIIDSWNKYYPLAPDKTDLDKLSGHSRLFEAIEQPNLLTLFFSYNGFKVLHLNKLAANLLGDSVENLLHGGAASILNKIDAMQRSCALANISAVAALMVKATPEELAGAVSNYTNIKLAGKNNRAERILFQILPVQLAENGQPLFGMILLHDVAAFMHEHTWWCRYKVGNNIRYYNPENNALLETDILTQREIEILRLLRLGKSSKEIADELFLSANTIDNHRRNMLRKTGAVDTSALLHLALLCKLIS